MWSRLWGRNENGEQERSAPADAYLPEVEIDSARPPASTAHCTEADCEATEGWACAYRDRWGKECATTWCDRHVDFIGEMAFCRRHANVMRALASASNGLHDVKAMPSVEDRSLSLVSTVTHELEDGVLELLRRRFGAESGVQVLSDRSVRVIRPDPTRLVWERGWAAVKPEGYSGRVAIRVPVGEDPQLRLLVNNTLVMQTIPDWIQRRISGEPPNPDDHGNFRFRVLLAIEQAFDAMPKNSVTTLF